MQLSYIRKMTRLRVVDNSAIGRAAELAGKPAKCIHIYNKTHIGYLGDKVQQVVCDVFEYYNFITPVIRKISGIGLVHMKAQTFLFPTMYRNPNVFRDFQNEGPVKNCLFFCGRYELSRLKIDLTRLFLFYYSIFLDSFVVLQRTFRDYWNNFF